LKSPHLRGQIRRDALGAQMAKVTVNASDGKNFARRATVEKSMDEA
jgi:hypothetical protein